MSGLHLVFDDTTQVVYIKYWVRQIELMTLKPRGGHSIVKLSNHVRTLYM